MKILQMFRETSFSLFSDGKISIKRVLAWCFGMMILWMAGRVSIRVVPLENQEVFKHCYDGLLMTICVLLGASVLQDVAKNKAKSTVEQTTVETPPVTTTQTTITPPES